MTIKITERDLPVVFIDIEYLVALAEALHDDPYYESVVTDSNGNFVVLRQGNCLDLSHSLSLICRDQIIEYPVEEGQVMFSYPEIDGPGTQEVYCNTCGQTADDLKECEGKIVRKDVTV